jgi:hypothetical protein
LEKFRTWNLDMKLGISLGQPKLIYDEFVWSKYLLLPVDASCHVTWGSLSELIVVVQKSAKRAVRHRSEELKLKRA